MRNAQEMKGVDDSLATKQVSAEAKATASQGDDKLTVASEITIDPKTGEKMLLGELVEAAKRGKGVDKLQSQLHKQQAELERIAQERAELAQQLQQIQKEQEKKQMFEEFASELGKGQEESFDWADDTPKIDPDQLVRKVEETAEKVTKNKLGDTREAIRQILMEEREGLNAERELQEAVQFARSTRNEAEKMRLKEDLGLDDESVERIMRFQAAADRKRDEAEALAAARQYDAMNEAYVQQGSYEAEIRRLQAEALRKKQDADRARELAEQLETGQILNVELEEEPEQDKRDWRPESLAKNKRLRRAQQLAKVQKFKEASQVTGIPLDDIARRFRK